MIALLTLLGAAALMPSSPTLGTAAGTCRAGESGPSIMIDVTGLADRDGRLRAELYPDNDRDFLQDDNVLLSAGKTFRRVAAPLPPEGPVRLCLRAPAPGRYALVVVHNRSGGHAFSLLHDGIGFAGNPVLGHAAPKAAAARVVVGAGPTPATIVMNYRRGLLSFGPLKSGR